MLTVFIQCYANGDCARLDCATNKGRKNAGNNLIRGDAPGPKRLRSTDIGLTLRRGPPGAPKTGEVQVAGRQRQPRGIIGERAQAVEE